MLELAKASRRLVTPTSTPNAGPSERGALLGPAAHDKAMRARQTHAK